MSIDGISEADRTIHDPITGEEMTFLETAAESDGDRVVLRLTLAPGGFVPPHAHAPREDFECLEGTLQFHAYAVVVIAIPFRLHETRAWYTTWLLPIGLAVPAALANDPNIAPFYYAVTATCVVGLLLTMRDFFALNREV